MKTSEVGTVAHFFGENVRRVAFAANVRYSDGIVFYPLASCIFSKFDTLIGFCGQIVAPLHTCIVVIVKWGSRICIANRVTEGLEVKDHIFQINGEAGTHIGCSNFGFAQTQ